MRRSGVEFLPRRERPVRIPECVPTEHAEPEFALAGERSTWRLPFRLGGAVPGGAVLKLQIFAKRSNRLAFGDPQVDSPDADDHLTLRTPGGEGLRLRPDAQKGTFIVATPKAGLESGSRLIAVLGDTSGGGGGTTAPEARLLAKFFLLYLAGDEKESLATWTAEDDPCIIAACTVHVLGGRVHHLRAYAPSQVRPGEPFEMLVRPEDEFSNLSCEPPGELAVFIGEEAADAKAVPVPESTCVTARVRLEEEGVFRLRVRSSEKGKEAFTNPILCGKDVTGLGVYWGMIHGHTEMSDGAGSVEYYFRQMRDEAALDFAAPGDHDHLHETTDGMWRVTCNAVERWHEPDRFVTFLGYEWAKWRRNGDGDRNVYYLNDHRPMYRSDETNHPAPPDLFRALAEAEEEAIIIPHHTGHSGNFCDWKDHDPVRERLVEIFQIRGSYENSAEDGNPVPERRDEPPIPAGYVKRALAMGWRVGFTAGGDDHAGHAGTEFPYSSGKTRYKAGLMAVLTAGRTREAIWDALWNRRVVATTGPRILLTYELDGHPMGSELKAGKGRELFARRSLRIEFHGTAPAERIDVIRNNEVVHSFPAPGLDAELSWEDAAPLGEVLMPPAEFCPNPFCFYYVRAVQVDNEVAWASPTWIDVEEGEG